MCSPGAFVNAYTDTELVFPVHLNPVVKNLAYEILGRTPRVHLIEPLDYAPFANLMARSYLVLSDSGGIQEEAPALGKPVLVLRTETERPEAVEAGTVSRGDGCLWRRRQQNIGSIPPIPFLWQ
ncbi:UDP-N-acetylglucosamine 2-epimerase [Candidatus Contubernalis alkalaceticus]|nr:UDP-N-acetylglucosamine 2-epimerase [Candidatus Contubernalis alkalaceticus]UNC91244.1 UDP-N-acetylglucosamine 2-epimerase [Candidatus Contubernalis alkalaceticus]